MSIGRIFFHHPHFATEIYLRQKFGVLTLTPPVLPRPETADQYLEASRYYLDVDMGWLIRKFIIESPIMPPNPVLGMSLLKAVQQGDKNRTEELLEQAIADSGVEFRKLQVKLNLHDLSIWDWVQYTSKRLGRFLFLQPGTIELILENKWKKHGLGIDCDHTIRPEDRPKPPYDQPEFESTLFHVPPYDKLSRALNEPETNCSLGEELFNNQDEQQV